MPVNNNTATSSNNPLSPAASPTRRTKVSTRSVREEPKPGSLADRLNRLRQSTGGQFNPSLTPATRSEKPKPTSVLDRVKKLEEPSNSSGRAPLPRSASAREITTKTTSRALRALPVATSSTSTPISSKLPRPARRQTVKATPTHPRPELLTGRARSHTDGKQRQIKREMPEQTTSITTSPDSQSAFSPSSPKSSKPPRPIRRQTVRATPTHPHPELLTGRARSHTEGTRKVEETDLSKMSEHDQELLDQLSSSPSRRFEINFPPPVPDSEPADTSPQAGLTLDELCLSFSKDRDQRKRTSVKRKTIAMRLLEMTREIKGRLSTRISLYRNPRTSPSESKGIETGRPFQSLPIQDNPQIPPKMIQTFLDIANSDLVGLKFNNTENLLDNAKKAAAQLTDWHKQLKAYCAIVRIESKIKPEEARKTLQRAKDLIDPKEAQTAPEQEKDSNKPVEIQKLDPRQQILALCKISREEAKISKEERSDRKGKQIDFEAAKKTLERCEELIPKIPVVRNANYLNPTDQLEIYRSYLLSAEPDGTLVEFIANEKKKGMYRDDRSAKEVIEECEKLVKRIERCLLTTRVETPDVVKQRLDESKKLAAALTVKEVRKKRILHRSIVTAPLQAVKKGENKQPDSKEGLSHAETADHETSVSKHSSKTHENDLHHSIVLLQRKVYLKIAFTEASFDPKKAKETLKSYYELVTSERPSSYLDLVFLVFVYCRIAEGESPELAANTLATCKEQIVSKLNPNEKAVAYCKLALVEVKLDSESAKKTLQERQEILRLHRISLKVQQSQKQPYCLALIYCIIASQKKSVQAKRNALKSCERIAGRLEAREQVVIYSKMALAEATFDPLSAIRRLRRRDALLDKLGMKISKNQFQIREFQLMDLILAYCKISDFVDKTDPKSARGFLSKAKELCDMLSPEQRQVVLFDIEEREREYEQRIWEQIDSYCKIAISQAIFDKNLAKVTLLGKCRNFISSLSVKDQIAAYFKIGIFAMRFDLDTSREILSECTEVARQLGLAKQASVYYEVAMVAAAVDFEFTQQMLEECKEIAAHIDWWERSILMREVIKFEAQFNPVLALQTLMQEEEILKGEKSIPYQQNLDNIKKAMELLEKPSIAELFEDPKRNWSKIRSFFQHNTDFFSKLSSAISDEYQKILKLVEDVEEPTELPADFSRALKGLESELKNGMQKKSGMVDAWKELSQTHSNKAKIPLEELKKPILEELKRRIKENLKTTIIEKLKAIFNHNVHGSFKELEGEGALRQVSLHIARLKKSAEKCAKPVEQVDALLEVVELEALLNSTTASRTLETVKKIARKIKDSDESELCKSKINKTEGKVDILSLEMLEEQKTTGAFQEKIAAIYQQLFPLIEEQFEKTVAAASQTLETIKKNAGKLKDSSETEDIEKLKFYEVKIREIQRKIKELSLKIREEKTATHTSQQVSSLYQILGATKGIARSIESSAESKSRKAEISKIEKTLDELSLQMLQDHKIMKILQQVSSRIERLKTSARECTKPSDQIDALLEAVELEAILDTAAASRTLKEAKKIARKSNSTEDVALFAAKIKAIEEKLEVLSLQVLQDQKITELLQKVSSRIERLKASARECIKPSDQIDVLLEVVEIEAPLSAEAAYRTLGKVKRMARDISNYAESELCKYKIAKMEEKLEVLCLPELLKVQRQIKTSHELKAEHIAKRQSLKLTTGQRLVQESRKSRLSFAGSKTLPKSLRRLSKMFR